MNNFERGFYFLCWGMLLTGLAVLSPIWGPIWLLGCLLDVDE